MCAVGGGHDSTRSNKRMIKIQDFIRPTLELRGVSSSRKHDEAAERCTSERRERKRKGSEGTCADENWKTMRAVERIAERMAGQATKCLSKQQTRVGPDLRPSPVQLENPSNPAALDQRDPIIRLTHLLVFSSCLRACQFFPLAETVLPVRE